MAETNAMNGIILLRYLLSEPLPKMRAKIRFCLHGRPAPDLLVIALAIALAFGKPVLASPAGKDEVRIALVIGQSRYRARALSTVEKAYEEAATIQSALVNANFDVTVRTDLNKAELTKEVANFRRKLEKYGSRGVGFVYYTGHGVQHPASRQSYLLGVEADLQSASDIVAYGLSIEQIRDNFEATRAGAIFLVFDACRNMPAFSGYKSSIKGLTRVEPADNMLIAYSTALGTVAREGVFAPVLAEELRREGRLAEAAFTAAQRRIAFETSQKQKPWSDNRLYSAVCLMGDCSGGSAPTSNLDRELWAQVNARGGTKGLCAGYNEYLNAFPRGEYIQAAKERMLTFCDEKPRPLGIGKAVVLTVDEENSAFYKWQNDYQFSTNPTTIEDFLKRYPTGRHVEPAQRKLRKLRQRSR